ncbi:hypothetical protein KW850_05850 [Bacillus sp. sid0103]|uniref:hypothetical protein n=1 Tax=Bacillaceae TaxID=186817 RepID=UPI001C48D5DB|nr:hypothetical protein [Bacillus sp. sid0103]MBV7504787.1 hypothetical protein [Bacillus sp. sid0103]
MSYFLIEPSRHNVKNVLRQIFQSAELFGAMKPLVDTSTVLYMVFNYDDEDSKAVMSILKEHLTIATKEDQDKTASFSLFDTVGKDEGEIQVFLGSKLKPGTANNKPVPPPNLTNYIESEAYKKSNQAEQTKLKQQQIKYNANELRKLIFSNYADIDMGPSRSKTIFSDYAQALASEYENKMLLD